MGYFSMGHSDKQDKIKSIIPLLLTTPGDTGHFEHLPPIHVNIYVTQNQLYLVVKIYRRRLVNLSGLCT